MFPYSKRKGTPAAEFPDHILKKVKEQRVKDLLAVAQQSQKDFGRRFIGRPVEILIERVDSQGGAIGYTPQYVQVQLPAGKDGRQFVSGQFVTVILEEGFVGVMTG